jgi:group I intron endonuclease
MFVYLVTNKINGKRYVGQHSGNNLEQYWNHCVVHALNGKHGKNRLLYRAIRKYKPENFSIQPLVIVDSKWEMDRYEIGMIAAWDLCNPEKGYNLAAGGRGTIGYKFSEESLRKLSESHKGIKQSEETKIKRANALRGQKRTEETRKRLSESLKGNKNCLGRVLSEEARKFLSDINKGNKNALGAIRTPEYCRQKSESQIGHKFSIESRQRMSESAKKRKDTDITRAKKSQSAINLGLRPPKLSQEELSRAGKISGHRRYHIARGIINPQCALCMGVQQCLSNT